MLARGNRLREAALGFLNDASNKEFDGDVDLPFTMMSESATPGFLSEENISNDKENYSELYSQSLQNETYANIAALYSNSCVASVQPKITNFANIIKFDESEYSHTLCKSNTNMACNIQELKSESISNLTLKPDVLGINRMDNNVYKDNELGIDDDGDWWVSAEYYYVSEEIDFDYDPSFVYYGILI